MGERCGMSLKPGGAIPADEVGGGFDYNGVFFFKQKTAYEITV